MKMLPINMEVWNLSQQYDRIKNCMAVRPPYEVEWSYSNELFLDKRKWLSEKETVTAWYVIYDYVDIAWTRYYLYKNGTQLFIGVFIAWVFTQISSWYQDSWVHKIILWRWATWPTVNLDPTYYAAQNPTYTKPNNKDFPSLPNYSGWYAKLDYDKTGLVPITDDHYMVFRNGPLVWLTTKVLTVESWALESVYFVSNSRGTLPYAAWQTGTGATFDAYTSYGNVILIWHEDGVNMLVVDWTNQVQSYALAVTEEPVLDMATFNGSIFFLTKSFLHFSEKQEHSNTMFHPLDYFEITGGESLFVIWKAMIVFAMNNQIIAPLAKVDGTFIFAGYWANYAGKPFWKESVIFADWTVYILQKDKQLMEVAISQQDNVTFEIQTKNAMEWNRWIFDSIPDTSDVKIMSDQRYLHFLVRETAKTTNYRYDKQMKFWSVDDYAVRIEKFSDEVLSWNVISEESWYQDLWADYQQEVKFSFRPWPLMWFVQYLRTLFWLIEEAIDVNFKVEFDLWWRNDVFEKRLTSFEADTRLSESLTWEELVGYDEVPESQTEYDWRCLSVQIATMKTWRFVTFTYSWINRFQIWHSVVLYDESKPYVNELSNNQ